MLGRERPANPGSAPRAPPPARCRRRSGPRGDREVRRQRQLLQAHEPRARARGQRDPSASAARCSSGSGCQRCWTSPTRSGARVGSSTRASDGGGSPSAVISFRSLTRRSLGREGARVRPRQSAYLRQTLGAPARCRCVVCGQGTDVDRRADRGAAMAAGTRSALSGGAHGPCGAGGDVRAPSPGPYRYCRSILHNDEDARDALQSTMAKALAALRDEQRDFELRPWLFRIAHNEAISRLRQRRDVVDLDAVGTSGPIPSETLEEQRAPCAAARRPRGLPERQRSALVLRELNGLSHREIAQVLDCTPASRSSNRSSRREPDSSTPHGKDAKMACDAPSAAHSPTATAEFCGARGFLRAPADMRPAAGDSRKGSRSARASSPRWRRRFRRRPGRRCSPTCSRGPRPTLASSAGAARGRRRGGNRRDQGRDRRGRDGDPRRHGHRRAQDGDGARPGAPRRPSTAPPSPARPRRPSAPAALRPAAGSGPVRIRRPRQRPARRRRSIGTRRRRRSARRASASPRTGAVPAQACQTPRARRVRRTAQAKRQAAAAHGRRAVPKAARSHPAHPGCRPARQAASASKAHPAHPEHPAVAATRDAGARSPPCSGRGERARRRHAAGQLGRARGEVVPDLGALLPLSGQTCEPHPS